jgi:hypothetical protein
VTSLRGVTYVTCGSGYGVDDDRDDRADGDDFEVSYARGLAWVRCTECGQSRPAGTPSNGRALAAVKADHKCGGLRWHEAAPGVDESPWPGLGDQTWAVRRKRVNPTSGGVDP